MDPGRRRRRGRSSSPLRAAGADNLVRRTAGRGRSGDREPRLPFPRFPPLESPRRAPAAGLSARDRSAGPLDLPGAGRGLRSRGRHPATCGAKRPARKPGARPTATRPRSAAGRRTPPRRARAAIAAAGDRTAPAARATTTRPRGDYRQQAIEIWSRIFLIDINNSEAVGAHRKGAPGHGGRQQAGRREPPPGPRKASRRATSRRLERRSSRCSRWTRPTPRPAPTSTGSSRSSLVLPPVSTSRARLPPRTSSPRRWPWPRRRPSWTSSPSRSRKRRGSRTSVPRNRPRLARVSTSVSCSLSEAPWSWRSPSARTSCSGQVRRASADGGRRRPVSRESDRALPRRKDPRDDRGAEAHRSAAPRLRPRTEAADLPHAQARGRRARPAARPRRKAPAGEAPAEGSGPPAASVAQREVAEKALGEKRYIDALKAFAVAAPAFQNDPSFTSQMG